MYDRDENIQIDTILLESLKGKEIEFRGISFDASIVLDYNALSDVAETVHAAHFNFIFLPLIIRGLPLYESEVCVKYGHHSCLHSYKHRDQYAGLIKRCSSNTYLGTSVDVLAPQRPGKSRSGRKLWQFYKEWSMRSPDDNRIEKSDEDNNGRRVWLCPSNPAYRRYLGDMVSEMVERLPISAFIFDISFIEELPEICMCNTCRQWLIKAGWEKAVKNWKEFQDKESVALHWLKWIQQQILEFMGHLRIRIKAQRPDIISMLTVNRSSILSESLQRRIPWYYIWRESLVDELIIYDYARKGNEFRQQISGDISRFQIPHLFLPCITSTEVEYLADIIRICQQLPLSGFIFKYNRHILTSEIQDLDTAVFTTDSYPGELSPYQACHMITRKIVEHIRGPAYIKQFFVDMLKMMTILPSHALRKWLYSVVKNLHKFACDIDKGKIVIDAPAPSEVLCDITKLSKMTGYLLRKM